MQLMLFAILQLSIVCISCMPQNRAKNQDISKTEQSNAKETNLYTTNKAKGIDRNIRSIFQDSKGNYWFGTNASGVYRYDGVSLMQFTEKNELGNNQILSIQEDKFGNIWFGTGLFGVSRFDGQSFKTFTTKENMNIRDGSANDWKIEPDDLWFNAGSGVYHSNGVSFAYLPFPKPDFDARYSQGPANRLSAYATYSILKDKKGNLWFGTQAKGVCRYDGKTISWYTGKGLLGPAVLALFEDSKGNIWFGNNGSGLFMYDGKSLLNFTEEKGLGNTDFRNSGQSGPGTLARIYSINEDNSGNLWIGTVDAGVWRFDGKNLTNFTIKDGLSSNAINTIYKDKNGELWFGTDGNGVCRFNGITFYEFVIK